MAVYNVTKHAVVTLTETLAGDLHNAGADGVGASVLCPGWVDTDIHRSQRNRPGIEQREDTEAEALVTEFVGSLLAGGLAPDDVAALVVDAVRTRRFYILTHPDWAPMVTDRTARIVAGDDPAMGMLPM